MSGQGLALQPLAVTMPSLAPAAPSQEAAAAKIEPKPALFQRIAFVLLCVYLVSNLANDWSQRFFGERAFLSLISGVALPIVCLLGGTILMGLRSNTGRLWTLFLLWTVITIPMSSWRGGSVAELQQFATKNYPIFFYCAATLLTLSQVRTLFYVMCGGGAAVLLSCVFFGDMGIENRLKIPGSIFFDNPNDLALQLLISSGFFLFLMLSRKWALKAMGGIMVIMAFVYVLQTGSRANFISLVISLAVGLILVKRKVILVGAVALVGLLAAATLSADQWSRLFYIVLFDDSPVQANDGDYQSQLQRTELLKYSVRYTLENPLFGVGLGQFPDQVWSRAKAVGKRVPSMGTHNSYTQVSSELGIPALLLYTGTLFTALQIVYRLYKKTTGVAAMSEVNAMALCLLLTLVVYAVSTMFHHVAYSRHLPTLAGMAVALSYTASRRMEALKAAAAPPNPQASPWASYDQRSRTRARS